MRRFLERIEQKGEHPEAAPIIIVAFGDSVTQGVMEYGRLDPENVYHRLLQQKLEKQYPLTTFSTINAGVSGCTAKAGLNRIERDVIRHQPDLVLIGFGLNDSLEGAAGISDFTKTLHNIISRIRNETPADIILLTPSFMADRINPRIHEEHLQYAPAIINAQNEGSLESYARAIRSAALNEKTGLADIHAEWKNLTQSGAPVSEWLINGLNHPDPRGHRIAAETIFTTLTLCPPIKSTTAGDRAKQISEAF